MNHVCCAIVFNENDEVLILKRADSIKSSPGVWNFPGGSTDEGETRWETAARELYEEAALVVQKEDLKYIGNLDNSKNRIHFFIGERFTGDVSINWESSDFKWVSYDELSDYEFPGGGPLHQRIMRSIEAYLEDKND